MKEDYLNIFFMLVAGAFACFMPFEQMLFVYAFVGPAHYLTQLSWMHKKNYFLKQKIEALPLVILTLLIVVFPAQYQHLMAITLSSALILVLVQKWWPRILLITLASTVWYFYQTWQGTALLIFFLPTLIHVFIFTVFFILTGALKRRSLAAFLSLLVLITIATVLLLFPMPSDYSPEELFRGNMRFFEEDISKLVSLFRAEGSWDQLVSSSRFVAFAYTYHYLNWFSKTETIGWHRITRGRGLFLVALYLVFIGLYLYDFVTGFKALVFLSLLHVVLELPLNGLTFRGLIYRKSSP